MTICESAGITGILTAAGLGEQQIHHWFGTPREQLAGLTPRAALGLRASLPDAGQVVLELAQADVIALKADREAIA